MMDDEVFAGVFSTSATGDTTRNQKGTISSGILLWIIALWYFVSTTAEFPFGLLHIDSKVFNTKPLSIDQPKINTL